MRNALQRLAASPSGSLRWPALVVALAAAIVVATGALVAQKPPSVRLNKMIEKFAQGKTAFGTTSSERSLEYAQSISRSDLDWLMIDMEHGSMDFQQLRVFLLGMTDKAAILRQGNPRPNVTPIVRLPQYGREPLQFMIKQALDLGVFGIVYPSIETKEQALNAVRAMRYPQHKGSPDMEPLGQRGSGSGNAVWFWGIPSNEYDQRADLWPLDPQGELLAIPMIESVEGMKHADEIAAVPGVGALLIGPGDMSYSLGVGGYAAALGGEVPEVENALQTVLKVCLARKIPCGSTGNAKNIAGRIKEGFRFFSVGGGGMSAGMEAALRAGRAADK